MEKQNMLMLDGEDLRIGQLRALVYDPQIKVGISKSSLRNVRSAQNFLSKQLNNRIIYGINTGFGPMATHLLGRGQLLELQENLIRSHAVGMGNPIDDKFVLASMVVRLNTLAKGYSGVSIELLESLQRLINFRIIPIIPEHGAVGTSGDLVQLAHIALAILGEGSVKYENKIYETRTLFKKLKIKPYRLKPKEGLSLINGTSVMSGIGSLVLSDSERLISLSVKLGALALELVEAYSDSISQELHQLRPHRGQNYIAKNLRSILASSELLKNRVHHTASMKLNHDVQELPQAIQEVYSLRCIAQILGPVFDTYEKSKRDLQIEINSVTDNPLVDVAHKEFIHGGNFHGDYIAASMDQLKAGIIKMTMLSERRINYFMNNKINKKFPPFLNLKKPGLTLGLQGLQFVATSTTALSQSLGYPHHLHSIPTNGDNQDVVSMGTDAALLSAKVIDNAYIVLTIEAVTLCQAVDFLQGENKLSKPTRQLYDQVRQTFPKVVADRSFQDELARLMEVLRHSFVLKL